MAMDFTGNQTQAATIHSTLKLNTLTFGSCVNGMGKLAVSEKTGERNMEGGDGCSGEQIYVTHKPK
jgi:hypothetical protein